MSMLSVYRCLFVPAVLLASLCQQSCGKSGEAAGGGGYTEERPLNSKGEERNITALLAMSAPRDCPMRDQDLSPTEYEQSSFESRTQNGLVVQGMNLRCVARKYSRREISVWVDEGDPVATYVAAVGYDDPLWQSCRQFGVLKAQLLSAFERGKNLRGGNIASRVPEAFIAVGVLSKECGIPGGDQYYVDAPAAGLDVVNFFGGAW